MPNYKIIEAQSSAAVFGGHNFFILVDENGTRLQELHGFAQDSNGVISATALSGTLIFSRGYTPASDIVNQSVVADLPSDQIMAMWNAAEACGKLVSTKAYSYNPLAVFGENSNAMASTLAKCMGVVEATFGLLLTPGKGDILLSDSEISEIQLDFGLVACVSVDSYLPGGVVAGDIKTGQELELADQESLEKSKGVVSYSEMKEVPGYRITTASGCSLICSATAPIPTKQGLVKAPFTLDLLVAVRCDEEDNSHVGWEKVTKVESLGSIKVQHITVGDKCFWAGEKKNNYILHHNSKATETGGGPIDQNFFTVLDSYVDDLIIVGKSSTPLIT